MPENVQCASFFLIWSSQHSQCVKKDANFLCYKNCSSRWGAKRNKTYLQHGLSYVSDNLMGSLQTEREDEVRMFNFENLVLITYINNVILYRNKMAVCSKSYIKKVK
jgi:hypothetical protein